MKTKQTKTKTKTNVNPIALMHSLLHLRRHFGGVGDGLEASRLSWRMDRAYPLTPSFSSYYLDSFHTFRDGLLPTETFDPDIAGPWFRSTLSKI